MLSSNSTLSALKVLHWGNEWVNYKMHVMWGIEYKDEEKRKYQYIQSWLSRHLAGLCSVRRWSSPAGRPSPPLRLTFWTNWWDAHLATMPASDQTSKVTNMQWRAVGGPPLSGQVWESALLILHNNLCSELAQIIHRWVRSERCCRLWYFHTGSLFFSSSLSCVVTVLCWPTALGYDIFTQASLSDYFFLSEMSSYPRMSPHRPISSQSQSLVVSEARRFPLTYFPLSLWGRISYIFHTCSTSLSSACWVNPSWLSIYTLM